MGAGSSSLGKSKSKKRKSRKSIVCRLGLLRDPPHDQKVSKNNLKPNEAAAKSTTESDVEDCSITSSFRGHIIEHIKERVAEESFKINNVGVDIRSSQSIDIEHLYEGLHDGPVLGYGVGGLVRLATHKITGIEYAVKFLSTERIDEGEALLQLREEIEILMGVDHPNIVKVEGVYESLDKIYVVQELCRGGDLFDRLDAQPDEHYSEAQCARLVKQMLSAVRYIHSQGIVHRDLKLENFLFDHSGPDSELKMIDFGLSKHFKSGDVQHEPVGTKYTVAPEVLCGSYDEKVDIWAIGVLTFILLSGQSPFGGCGEYDRTPQEVKRNILSANFKFQPDDIWSNVSDQAKGFISNILVVDPNRRMTAEQCQLSPWIQEWTVKERKERNTLNPHVISALRSFGKLSDVRKLLCEIIGFTLLPHQIIDLRKEFEKLDVEQSGEISLQNLKKVLLVNAGNGAFGNVTEKEVESIFDSLHLHKDHLHIHWHEFIAAGLSQCSVEDANLRLAFNKIDAGQKGYITFDDFNRFTGPTIMSEEESLRDLWEKVMQSHSSDSKIHYDEFKMLMKEDQVLL